MKAWIFSIILLIVIACSPVTQATGPTGEELPPYLEQVKPEDGSTVSNKDLYAGVVDTFDGICADFNFQRRFGPAPQELITFFLDDRDVKFRIRMTMDLPVSGGAVCYAPLEPLEEGWHEARIVYRDMGEEKFAYRWRFEVQDPPDYVAPPPRPTITPRTPGPTQTPPPR